MGRYLPARRHLGTASSQAVGGLRCPHHKGPTGMARAILSWVGILLAYAGYVQSAGPQFDQPAPATAPSVTIDRYCIRCHNEKLKTAGLMLD